MSDIDSEATEMYDNTDSDESHESADRDTSVRDEEKGRRKKRHPELWDDNVRKESIIRMF